MPKVNRHLKVLTDGTPFAENSRFHLYGKTSIGLYPDLFLLDCWNLSDQDVFQLQNTRELAVMHGDSCLAFGKVSDVFCRTVPEGTVTTVAFSLGLNLWESWISLSVLSETPVSETIRQILSASGIGIQLLSFPGDDPIASRGQSFCDRAAECIMEALSAVSARCYLVPSGLCIIPADPLPPTLHLSESDLTDRPAVVDRGRKMILYTSVTGFQPGDEMTLQYKGSTSAGLIVQRMVDADIGTGPWTTQLLIELR